MRATFAGFATAQYALSSSQNHLNVVGQNIANVNTVGYTKQRSDQISLNLTNQGTAFNIGYGSLTTSISQLRDPYLDLRFRGEIAKVGEADVVTNTLYELEDIFDEIAKVGIQEGLTDLSKALQDLSLNVSSDEFQEMVKGASDSLMNLINQYSNQLDALRQNATSSLEDVDVPRVNDILSDIADLNVSIEKTQLLGGSALELQDERNLLLDELASYMDITIKYIDTEVQPGVSIDRLNISLSQKTYNEDGTSNTSSFTILNGSFAGSFNFETNADGLHGITFTSAIGDAMNDAEGVSKLNNVLTSLSNVNEKLVSIADGLAEATAAYEAAIASGDSYTASRQQVLISELATQRSDYMGMRDNFLNSIEAFIDIEWEADSDTGAVEVTFLPKDVTIYDVTDEITLPTDSTIGDLTFEMDADGIVSFDGETLGDLNLTEESVEILNNFMANFATLYEQLDSIYEDLLVLENTAAIDYDTDGNPIDNGSIAYAQLLSDLAKEEMVVQNAVVTNALKALTDLQSYIEEQETTLIVKNQELTTATQNLATAQAELADAITNGLPTDEIDVKIAEYQAEIAELNTSITDITEEIENLKDADEVALQEAYDNELITFQYIAKEKAAADELIEARTEEQTNLLEERVGLLEQRDSFLTTMGLILDMEYTLNTDKTSADYGKIDSFTFTTANTELSTDPDTTPVTLLGLPTQTGTDANGDPVYSSDMCTIFIDSEGNVKIGASDAASLDDFVDVTLGLTTDFISFTTGSFKGSLDTLNYSGEDNTLRGISYYEKQLDELVITFADIMNDLNTNKAAGYNVGETDELGKLLYAVTDTDGNQYHAVVDANGDPISATGLTLDNTMIVGDDGNLYTTNTDIGGVIEVPTGETGAGGAAITVSTPVYSGEPYFANEAEIADITLDINNATAGTIQSDPNEYTKIVKDRTGIPQYNEDGSPLLDKDGFHIFHDEALQLDANGNNVGNNFLFTYDPADPAGTITAANDWIVGNYGITTSVVEGAASGANDNILAMINALSADHSFVTTTSDPPFTSGDQVSTFSGTFYEYFSNTCITLGLDIKTNQGALDNAVNLVSDISDSINAVSGVSLDEEGISLLQYQKSYQAAARLMTALDSALEILLNMGKVGR